MVNGFWTLGRKKFSVCVEIIWRHFQNKSYSSIKFQFIIFIEEFFGMVIRHVHSLSTVR